MAVSAFRYPYHIADLEASLFGEPSTGAHPTQASLDHAIALLEDNARALEDWLSGLGGTLPPFDFPGPLAVSVSDLWSPVSDETVSKFVFTLAALSTTAISIGVFKNNSSVATISLTGAATVTPVTLPTPISLIGGADTLQLRILSPGTGSAGLLGQPG